MLLSEPSVAQSSPASVIAVGACLWGTRPLLIGAARDAALLVLSIARLLPVLDSVAMPPRHYAHALICSVDTTGGLGSPGRLLPDQNLASAPPSDLSVSHRELSEKYTYVGCSTRSCDNVRGLSGATQQVAKQQTTNNKQQTTNFVGYLGLDRKLG